MRPGKNPGRENKRKDILLAYLLPSRLYCRYRSFTDSALLRARGLYRRWGIAPRPEDTVQFSYNIALAGLLVKGQLL